MGTYISILSIASSSFQWSKISSIIILFLLEEPPLANLQGYICQLQLSVFLLLRNSWFPFHSWRIVSPDIKFTIDSSLLSAFEKRGATSFWPPLFQMRNLLLSELIFPYRKNIVFLWPLSILFSLVFQILIIVSWHESECICFSSCVFIFQTYTDIFWSYSQWIPALFSVNVFLFLLKSSRQIYLVFISLECYLLDLSSSFQ